MVLSMCNEIDKQLDRHTQRDDSYSIAMTFGQTDREPTLSHFKRTANRWINRHTDQQGDGQTTIQIDQQTGRQINRQKNKPTGRHINEQVDRQTNRKTDKQVPLQWQVKREAHR